MFFRDKMSGFVVHAHHTLSACWLFLWNLLEKLFFVNAVEVSLLHE